MTMGAATSTAAAATLVGSPARVDAGEEAQRSGAVCLSGAPDTSTSASRNSFQV